MAEREWLPDPTGRHPFRSRKSGEWSDLVAVSTNGDGIETDTEGGREARAGASGTASASASQQAASGCGKWALGLGVLVAALIGISMIRTSMNSTTYVAAVTDIQVENPASVRVFVNVVNSGDNPGMPECTVRAADPTGAYSGFEVFEMLETVAPGETGTFNGTIVITNQGAGFVDEASVECD